MYLQVMHFTNGVDVGSDRKNCIINRTAASASEYFLDLLLTKSANTDSSEPSYLLKRICVYMCVWGGSQSLIFVYYDMPAHLN